MLTNELFRRRTFFSCTTSILFTEQGGGPLAVVLVEHVLHLAVADELLHLRPARTVSRHSSAKSSSREDGSPPQKVDGSLVEADRAVLGHDGAAVLHHPHLDKQLLRWLRT